MFKEACHTPAEDHWEDLGPEGKTPVLKGCSKSGQTFCHFTWDIIFDDDKILHYFKAFFTNTVFIR